MRKLILLTIVSLVIPLIALAQSQDTIYLRAGLSPTKETPPVTSDANGVADILILLNRNANGDVVSAHVDFKAEIELGQEQTFVAMHIHRGAAGTAGPVVIGSGLAPTDMVTAGPGRLRIFRQVFLEDPADIETALAVADNPAGYYVNVHTRSNPPGYVRGNLHPVELSAISAVEQQVAASSADLAARLEALEAQVNAIRTLQIRIAERLSIRP